MAWTTTTTGVVWQPPTDVYETAADFVVRIEVGGIDPDQVEISVSDRVVSVTGTRKDPAPKVGYHRMEIFYGPFQTRAILPRRVDASQIQAQYNDGFLTVVVPKASPVRVRVESGEAEEAQAESK
jgi:HSP20 family protein